MKKKVFITALFVVAICFTNSYAEEISLDNYIASFDYDARKDMKIDSEALVKGIQEGKIQFIDIRFKEEVEAWSMGFSTSIPLNELPKRLNELDKNKIIVTACPHKDRAGIAMVYLRTKGFNSKYLEDGLVGLAEYLRGDKARDFVNSLNSK
ncbi:MAG: rhodanese-like domain-containing protein [Desulfamplus sp.]